jgi:hypothetical protein
VYVEQDYRTSDFYLTVAGPNVTLSAGSNTGQTVGDAGAAQTWSSGVHDMTQTVGGDLRFWPGQAIDPKDGPFKNKVTDNVVSYARQDEIVHYEDLRGVYSRGSLPVAQVKKVSSVGPFYLNPFRHTELIVRAAYKSPSYPAYHVGENSEWFRMGFRSEYLWESGSMFPTTARGSERLEGVLWWRTRYFSTSVANGLAYDTGAWTGWKDDRLTGTQILGGRGVIQDVLGAGIITGTTSPFETGFMPVAIGPVLPQTAEVAAHLVLVPERRGGA